MSTTIGGGLLLPLLIKGPKIINKSFTFKQKHQKHSLNYAGERGVEAVGREGGEAAGAGHQPHDLGMFSSEEDEESTYETHLDQTLDDDTFSPDDYSPIEGSSRVSPRRRDPTMLEPTSAASSRPKKKSKTTGIFVLWVKVSTLPKVHESCSSTLN